MKITCQREQFSQAFQIAAMFAPGRSPKTILQNVKLTVGKNGGVLQATDMEVGVRVNLEGIEVEKPGSAVLPVANFGSILRENSDERLSLETDSRGTLVRGDRSEFKFPSADPDEFPDVVEFNEEKYHAVSARLFRELILRTEFATDTESSRYALGGVLLELEPARITAVGTAGRRLARMDGPAEAISGHKGSDANTIVRTQSMRLIGRALTEADEVVHLAVHANDVLLRTQRCTFYSRLVEGRYPRWRDVFPKRTDAIKLNLTVGPFHSALRQAAIACDNDSRGIDFTLVDGTLTLAASTADKGQSRVEMPIPYGGAKLTVTLDHRFVSDFLKVLNPQATVEFEMENGEAAVVFYADDAHYGYVVMPLSRDS